MNIKHVEVYDNGFAVIQFENGDRKTINNVIYTDAILSGVETSECDYCGENVKKLRPSPFMADIGADMCKKCWDMTRETYIGSEGTDIGRFEDYKHFKKEETK